jgi:hypothetical protein
MAMTFVASALDVGNAAHHWRYLLTGTAAPRFDAYASRGIRMPY